MRIRKLYLIDRDSVSAHSDTSDTYQDIMQSFIGLTMLDHFGKLKHQTNLYNLIIHHKRVKKEIIPNSTEHI